MNIFKMSYNIERENGKEIYKGFGFYHLSDATSYYVHPNNQSYTGTTTLCQPIGESLTLFSELISSIINTDIVNECDYYFNDSGTQVFMNILIPENWRQNGVVDKNIYRYAALVSEEDIMISAYDSIGRWIDDNMQHLEPLYKLLPCFTVLLARECRIDSDFNQAFMKYLENPTVDSFVNLHEDFYQAHKLDDYDIAYTNLSGIDTDSLVSFRENYEVIAENKASLNQKIDVEIIRFPETSFLEEYHYLVPSLSREFHIPEIVQGICSA
ncbi:MAG: hypothetical protein FWG21_07200, partial [Oscillospiraceae bacterium]|nr:hypothetical protein [Oscillospiraceae bacterium]